MKNQNWINELKAIRSEHEAKLASLEFNALNLREIAMLLCMISEVNKSIIAEQDRIIESMNEVERKVA